MPRWLSLNFQDSRSFNMRELRFLHDHVIIVIVRIIILITYIIIFIIKEKKSYKFISEGTLIETIWSMVPALLLITLVIPSIKILYLVEDIKTPKISIKVVAHQWYWSYLYPNLKNSFIKEDATEIDRIIRTESPIPRLLEASSDLTIPVITRTRLLISSTDVIHSFTVPSLGLKVDAVPGRIRQLFSNPSRIGQFFGQCSEICGANHSFIPIRVKISSIEEFNKTIKVSSINRIIR